MHAYMERTRINKINTLHFANPNHFAKKKGFFPFSRGGSLDCALAGDGVCFVGVFALPDMK